jgi:hypothetical protein
MGEVGPCLTDRSWQPLDLVARAVELDPVAAAHEGAIKIVDSAPRGGQPRLHLMD